jgi:hypothetical protein
MTPAYMQQTAKSVSFSERYSEVSNVIETRCVGCNIEISEDETRDIYFSHRFRSTEPLLTINAWNIPFCSRVKYVAVIFDNRIAWRLHIEMIGSQAFRTDISIYLLFKISV